MLPNHRPAFATAPSNVIVAATISVRGNIPRTQIMSKVGLKPGPGSTIISDKNANMMPADTSPLRDKAALPGRRHREAHQTGRCAPEPESGITLDIYLPQSGARQTWLVVSLSLLDRSSPQRAADRPWPLRHRAAPDTAKLTRTLSLCGKPLACAAKREHPSTSDAVCAMCGSLSKSRGSARFYQPACATGRPNPGHSRLSSACPKPAACSCGWIECFDEPGQRSGWLEIRIFGVRELSGEVTRIAARQAT